MPNYPYAQSPRRGNRPDNTVASRVQTAGPPPPTHAPVAEPESLFGPGRARWVSMAEALGWGRTDGPAPTVCAGGGPGGGPEPFPSGSRKTLTDARDRGTWTPHPGSETVLASPRESSGGAARPGENRPADAPTPAFATGANRWSWSLRSNNQTNATVRPVTEPAGTLFFGHRVNECRWVAHPASPADDEAKAVAPAPIRITAHEAGVLQTFPADYPWQGNKGQQFSQIGNAVPPRLAAHLLLPHLHPGKPFAPDDFTPPA
ncbi:DNA cytosine methyltransferase [Streptomyces sp. S3(2020)]|nr:DNA cytosine methyltransferase [Streptomyces sp. S3(2020)]